MCHAAVLEHDLRTQIHSLKGLALPTHLPETLALRSQIGSSLTLPNDLAKATHENYPPELQRPWSHTPLVPSRQQAGVEPQCPAAPLAPLSLRKRPSLMARPLAIAAGRPLAGLGRSGGQRRAATDNGH